MIFDYDSRAGIMVVERSLGRRTPLHIIPSWHCRNARSMVNGYGVRSHEYPSLPFRPPAKCPTAPSTNALPSGVVCMSPTLGRWQLVNALPASNFAMPKRKTPSPRTRGSLSAISNRLVLLRNSCLSLFRRRFSFLRDVNVVDARGPTKRRDSDSRSRQSANACGGKL